MTAYESKFNSIEVPTGGTSIKVMHCNGNKLKILQSQNEKRSFIELRTESSVYRMSMEQIPNE